MFGIYRTILALIVVLQHIGGIKLVGTYAVFGFFCLSGFLMTLLMDTTYKGRKMDFAINRFLRLYPTYWFTALLVAVAVTLQLPQMRGDIGIPTGWDMVRAVLYIDYWRDNPTIITTGWAVTNELFWYVAIAFGISKTPQRSIVWLAVSILFAIGVVEYSARNSDLRYFSPLAGSLPFAFGACIYHFRSVLPQKMALPLLAVSSTAMVMCLLAAGMGYSGQLSRFTFLIAAGSIALSLYYAGNNFSKRVWGADRIIGDLSYPIYLNHYVAASIVMSLSPYHFTKPLLFMPTAGVAVVIAYLTNVILDHNVNKLRDRVRNNHRNVPPELVAAA